MMRRWGERGDGGLGWEDVMDGCFVDVALVIRVNLARSHAAAGRYSTVPHETASLSLEDVTI